MFGNVTPKTFNNEELWVRVGVGCGGGGVGIVRVWVREWVTSVMSYNVCCVCVL